MVITKTPEKRIYSGCNNIVEEYGWLPDNPDEVYIGVEIEHEYTAYTDRNVKARLIYEYFDSIRFPILLKTDGSISRGLEINTLPSTSEQITEAFKGYFSNFSSFLEVHDGVGVHIHVSRQPLTLLQRKKFTYFINNPDNKDFIIAMARRNPSQWACLNPYQCDYSPGVTVGEGGY